MKGNVACTFPLSDFMVQLSKKSEIRDQNSVCGKEVMQLSPILSKNQMTEEYIKLHYITPAITAQWHKDLITMETKITDGKINLKGNLVVREKQKKADYR